MTVAAHPGSEPQTLAPARLNVQNGVRVALLVILVLLVAGPLLALIISSLQPKTAALFDFSVLTLDNYRDVMFRPGTWQLVVNTLAYAGGSVTLPPA